MVAKANAMNGNLHPSFADLNVGQIFRLDGGLMTKISPRRALNQQGVKVELVGKTTVNPVS